MFFTRFFDDSRTFRSLSGWFSADFTRTLQLAAPAVLTGFGWMAMGLVDTVMVGDLGPEALAAVALANGIFYMVYVAFLGLLDAITPLISQALGAGHDRRAGAYLWQGVWLSLLTSPFFMALFFDFAWVLESLGQDPAVVSGASAYLSARTLGILVTSLWVSHCAFLNGVGRTERITRVVFFANLVNVVANSLLIHGWGPIPALGIRGAGYATVLARISMLFCANLEVRREFYRRYGLERSRVRPDLVLEIVRLGLPMSAQYTLEVSVFSLISICVGWISATALSAHQIACSLAGVAFVLAQGLATAATVQVGEAHGARRFREALRIGSFVQRMTVGVMVLSGLFCLSFPTELVSLYSEDVGIQARVFSILGITVAMGLFDGLQVVQSACLRARSDSRTPFVAHTLGYWGVGVPLGYFCAFELELGLFGFWLGILSALATTSGILALRIRSQAQAEGNLE